MLRKLLKYEFKATARLFLPLYALLLVFTGINRLFMELNKNSMSIPQGIAVFVYVAIIIAIFVVTFVVTIQRFQRNLLTDEGYLMHTLPVNPVLHLWTKLINSCVWMIGSVLMAIISVFALAVRPDSLSEFSRFMNGAIEVLNREGGVAWFAIFLAIVLLLVTLVSSILQIYFAIVIGNMSGSHKMLAGIGAYLGISVVQQIFATLIIWCFTVNGGFDHFASWFSNIPTYNYDSVAAGFAVSNFTMMPIILFMAVFGVLFFVFTNLILKKKLNLE